MEAILGEESTASEALGHPVRVRILEALNTRDQMSATQFLRSELALGLPSLQGKSDSAQMAHISYHFKALADAGCIVEVDSKARRGAMEHFFAARSRAYFSDEEWMQMDPVRRAEISRTMLQGFIAQSEGAMLAKTFDLRPDRWLAWVPFHVDERGWNELTTALGASYAEIEQIRLDSENRLTETEEKATPVTIAIFGFESPPMGNSPTASDRRRDR